MEESLTNSQQLCHIRTYALLRITFGKRLLANAHVRESPGFNKTGIPVDKLDDGEEQRIAELGTVRKRCCCARTPNKRYRIGHVRMHEVLDKEGRIRQGGWRRFGGSMDETRRRKSV